MFEYTTHRTLPGSSFYGLQLDELNAMGKDGWEAFAVTKDGNNEEDEVYHLKRKLEEKAE